jgi:hypothetical protein
VKKKKKRRMEDAMPYAEMVKKFYDQNLDGRVWPTGTFPCRDFPQIDMKPNFGIAISGGGLRAASCGLGWLRALNKYGLLTRARYISVNSGGSWVTEPMLWHVVLEINQKFAPGMSAAEVDAVLIGTIEEAANKMPSALSENFGYNVFSRTLTNMVPGMHTNVWSNAVDKIFDSVNPTDQPPQRNYLSLGSGREEASRLPFLIVNGTVAAVDRQGLHIAPFEFTPSYCGMPVDPRKRVGSPECFQNNGGFIHRTVFAVDYRNNDTATLDRGAWTVSVLRDKGQQPPMFKLSEIASISSSAVVEGYYESSSFGDRSAISQWIAGYIVNRNFSVEEQYWALNNEGDKVAGGMVKFADGGLTDNSGILALLRRGVTDIIACCAILFDVAETNEQIILDSVYDYMGLFGRVTNKSKFGDKHSADYNAARRVFDGQYWDELMDAMRGKRTRGEALVYTFPRLEVIANDRCGVAGIVDGNPYLVNITFVFNGRSTNYDGVAWDTLKPTYTSWADSHLNPLNLFSPHGLGPDFPIIPTEILHYSEELVKQLAGLAKWSLDEGSGTFLRELTNRFDTEAAARESKLIQALRNALPVA